MTKEEKEDKGLITSLEYLQKKYPNYWALGKAITSLRSKQNSIKYLKGRVKNLIIQTQN